MVVVSSNRISRATSASLLAERGPVFKTLLDAALSYADMGWRIALRPVPVREGRPRSVFVGVGLLGPDLSGVGVAVVLR